MLGKMDGMFQCFACLKCMDFGKEGYYNDAFIVEESQLRAPFSLKFMAATVAIRHEAMLVKQINAIPNTLKSYVNSLDPQEPGSCTVLNKTNVYNV